MSGRAKLAAAVTVGLVMAGGAHGKHHHNWLASLDSFSAVHVAGTSNSANEAMANALATDRGWGPQIGCLDRLWNRESGFNRLIMNPRSGAFGIAQALGHGSAAAADAVVYFPGGGSASNVTVNEYPSAAANAGSAKSQVNWGLGYVRATYGDPCAAWQHELRYGWY